MRMMLLGLLAGFVLSAAPGMASPAGPMSRIPGIENAIVSVQSRSCRACRRDCYGEFRIACGYSDYCRRQFTACMRACWEDYCR